MKTVYLTIDDAPSPDMGTKVEFLKARKIPAVWFCRGELLKRRSGPVIDAIRKGFVIGNHSFDHPHFSMITTRRGVSQIGRTELLIEQAYQSSGVPRPAKFFRFPYGDKGGVHKEFYQDYLRRNGFRQPHFTGIRYPWFRDNRLDSDADIYWTFDVAEYRIKAPRNVLSRFDRTAARRGGCLRDSRSADIVLIHDFIETTKLFYSVIEKLLGMGITFKLPTFK
jgi:peptidoglycan-N-acetylglucosamine deacetylase